MPGEQITLTLTDAGGTSHTYFGQTGSIDGSYTFSQLPTGTGEILLGNSYNCFGNFSSPFTVTVSSGTNTRNFTGIPNSRTATGTVTFPDNNPVAVNVRAHRDTPTGVVDDYAGLEPDRTTFHLQLYCDWSGYAEPYLVNPPNDAFIFEPANKHVDVLDNVNIGEFVAITNVSITEPLAGVRLGFRFFADDPMDVLHKLRCQFSRCSLEPGRQYVADARLGLGAVDQDSGLDR